MSGSLRSPDRSDHVLGHGSRKLAFADEHLCGMFALEPPRLFCIVASHDDLDIGI
jgi:hypothetical protein